jgi:hypothetical protein
MNTLIGILLLSSVSHLYAGDLKQELMDRINYIREHNDHSHFYLSASSDEQPPGDRRTKVHFIVTDSQGRKTGFESVFMFPEGDFGVNSYNEIPNSSYGLSQTPSLDPTIVPDGPESAVFRFFPPILKDTYTLHFIGLDSCRYSVAMSLHDLNGEKAGDSIIYETYITSGATQYYTIHLDPAPGAPAPAITKTVTFNILRDDVSVARQLDQLGDDRFARSLISNIDLAEKLAGVCDKRKAKKDNCEPAIAVLKLFIRRLELANRKCGGPDECDEEREWAAFRKEHGKDDDFKDFFREWDRDDWHKHKKSGRRFVTDEALKIISEDAGWLIKSLGGKTEAGRGKPGQVERD